MPAKTPNYTEEMTEELRTAYEAEPCPATVERFVEKFGKNKRSIVAKLSTMGIYKVPPRTTKTGEPIVKKEDLAEEICEYLNIEAPSLPKTNKRDLKTILAAVKEALS